MSYAKELGAATGHLIGNGVFFAFVAWFNSGKYGSAESVILTLMFYGVWFFIAPLVEVLTRPIRHFIGRLLLQDKHEGGSNG